MNTLEVKRIIRARFAWPGGYALFLTTSDGGTLCCACGRSEYRQINYSVRHRLNDGWRVDGYGNTSECEEVPNCDHCGKEIV